MPEPTDSRGDAAPRVETVKHVFANRPSPPWGLTACVWLAVQHVGITGPALGVVWSALALLWLVVLVAMFEPTWGVQVRRVTADHVAERLRLQTDRIARLERRLVRRGPGA